MKTYVYPKPNTENITYGDRKNKQTYAQIFIATLFIIHK